MTYAEIRPLHVADLLTREGHPLAARVSVERDVRAAELRDPANGRPARRALGMAAGAALVFGAVVAGALGYNNSPDAGPTASGEPVGATPSLRPDPGQGKPAPPKPQAEIAAPAVPAQDSSGPAAQAVNPQFTNNDGIRDQSRVTPSADKIGSPATVAPPARQAPVPPPPSPPVDNGAAAQGPVQTLAEPVTDTVSPTLTDVTAPVTSTVDDTLQPALSLIGGLLGR